MPKLSEDRINSIRNKYRQRLDEANPLQKKAEKMVDNQVNLDNLDKKIASEAVPKSPDGWEDYVLNAKASDRRDKVVAFTYHNMGKQAAKLAREDSDMCDEIYVAIANYGAVVGTNPVLTFLKSCLTLTGTASSETLNAVSDMFSDNVLRAGDLKGTILKILTSEKLEDRSNSDIVWLVKTAKFLDDPENKTKYFKGKEKTINAAALMFDSKGNLLDIPAIKRNLAANQSSEPGDEKNKSNKSDNLAVGTRGVNKTTVRQVRSIVPNMKEADLKELKSLINNVLNSMKKRNTDGKN